MKPSDDVIISIDPSVWVLSRRIDCEHLYRLWQTLERRSFTDDEWFVITNRSMYRNDRSEEANLSTDQNRIRYERVYFPSLVNFFLNFFLFYVAPVAAALPTATSIAPRMPLSQTATNKVLYFTKVISVAELPHGKKQKGKFPRKFSLEEYLSFLSLFLSSLLCLLYSFCWHMSTQVTLLR